MKKCLRQGFLGFLVLALVGILLVLWEVMRQGITHQEFSEISDFSVKVDENGFPTIEAGSWMKLIEAQGFTVASERLFQMDLIRRQAGGRLSELFGPKALEWDTKMRLEDRLGVAERSLSLLPEEERTVCEAYAAGVNRFISDHAGRWGIEYVVLRAEPEPWSCRDTLLVVLSMTDTLTSTSQNELIRGLWSARLDPAWSEFLFTYEHPWNEPFFGKRDAAGVRMPPPEKFIPMSPLAPKTEARIRVMESEAVGSNSWAWSGATGRYLVNDPHLLQGVPGIWYGLRLRRTPTDWVVGVTIAGLPGVVLGMNPHLSWGFTNTGEDVDDLLEEKISKSGDQYLVLDEAGIETWKPIEKRTFVINVKGEAPRTIQGRFTRRGPLQQYNKNSNAFYSRQWLGLRDGLLRIPSVQLNQAKSWDEFNAGIDAMAQPSQNILMMDRKGNIGYRASGTGILRSLSGRVPAPASKGEWLGLQSPSTRRRLFIPVSPKSDPTFLATANQRIWIDEHGHNWYNDDRQERIMSFLGARRDLTCSDMLALQLDTKGRFRQTLMHWVASKSTPENAQEQALVDRWRNWDGVGETHQEIFTQSIDLELELTTILLDRVRATFLPDVPKDFEYKWSLKRAWLLRLLETPEAMRAFGLRDGEVADHLVKQAVGSRPKELYPAANHWRAQHPFVANIPVIGRLFAVKEFDQVGYSDLVRAENKAFGPSVRMIWDMANPGESLWILPVGQSGHLRSPHYKDQHDAWFAGQAIRVFPKNEIWNFEESL